jgi:dUTP pyrophosphatase
MAMIIDKFGRLQVQIYRETDNPLPEYKKDGDAGMDIRSNEDVRIRAFSWVTIGTGLFIIIPYGYEGQVRSRSGLAAKHGLQVLNTPGTIDSGYRDELKVILINHNHISYDVKKGDRIAQLVIKPVVTADVAEIDKSKHIIESETENRGGGLGSTGVK